MWYPHQKRECIGIITELLVERNASWQNDRLFSTESGFLQQIDDRKES